jgi:hypothetical protein
MLLPIKTMESLVWAWVWRVKRRKKRKEMI